MVVRIPQKLRSEHLEPLLEELARSTEPVSVPAKISTTDPLALPLALQAVVTWSKFNKGGVVRTAFDFADTRAAAALQRNVVLLTAVLMASAVQSADGEDVTAAARQTARSALAAATTIPVRGSGQAVGVDRSVIAADHVSGLEYPSGLYRRAVNRATREVTHEIDSDARALYAHHHVDPDRRAEWPLGWRVLDMGRVSRTTQEDTRDQFRDEAYELGQVLFELMQNTHDHARTEEAGYTLRRSARGIHVHAHTQTRREMVEGAAAHYDLAQYFSQLPASRTSSGLTDEDRLRVLTVSVFDSGPGLAARILWQKGFRYNYTDRDELAGMLEALRKSEEQSESHELRLMGLTRVQRYLTEVGGYAMVRAGHFRLTRDFRRLRFQEGSDNQLHWYGNVQKPTRLTRVNGTMFTVVVPTYGTSE